MVYSARGWGVVALGVLSLWLPGCTPVTDGGGGEAPTVTLSVEPTSLGISQGHVEFTWATTNATDIVSTNFGIDAGPLGASGSGRAVKWVTIAGTQATFTITVRNAAGQTATAEAVVTVRGDAVNSPPHARCSNAVSSGDIASTIWSFDPTESWDEEQPPDTITMRFDWTGDGVFDTNWAPLAVTDHVFTEAEARACPPVPVTPPATAQENYRATVKMQVRDAAGATATWTQGLTLVIHSTNQAPEPAFTVTNPNGTFPNGFVDASASTDNEDGLGGLRFWWDWNFQGEDFPEPLLWTGWSDDPTATPPAYAGPGTYTILLAVMDSGGLVNWTTRQIVVP